MTAPATAVGLGWRTDLALLQQSGTLVEDAGTHLVVRTPDNPAFHWGNYLLLREVPAPGSGEQWLAEFVATFPDSAHVAIGLDLPHGSLDDAAPLVEVGLVPDLSVVLTAAALAPRPAPAGVQVRPLRGGADWEQRVDLALARYPSDDEGYAEFVRRRSASERRRTEAGHGDWWGAFEDGRLLAGLGLFDAGSGLARYQDVETHPDAERRGLASALLDASAMHARDRLGTTTLVIVADPEAGAAGLYRRLGFVDAEVQVGLDRS